MGSSKIINNSNSFSELPARHREFGQYQPVDMGRTEIIVFRQLRENMVALKRETGLKEASGRPEDPDNSPKAKFRVFGVEMVEKEVKPSGNTGRVYLPSDWVGKRVKIIRTD